MKKLLVVLLVVVSFVIGHFSSTLPVQASWIPEIWTDGIETSGVTKSISFHMLVCDWVNSEQVCTWHYFGTDPSEVPPSSSQWDIVEHAVIQFPSDLSYLGPEADGYLYDLAFLIANQIMGID